MVGLPFAGAFTPSVDPSDLLLRRRGTDKDELSGQASRAIPFVY